MRKITTLLAGAALVAAGCGGNGTVERVPFERTPSTTATPDSRPTPTANSPLSGWSVPELEWVGCGDLECATIEVPLDWDDLEGEQIELSLNKRRARGDKQATLFTNPGGPGASGLEFNRSDIFDSTITEQFDVVSWDPRGVGESSPVTCSDEVEPFQRLDSAPDTAKEQTSLNDAAKAIAEECATEDGDLLAHLGTVDVARDLDALRQAVGDDQLTYVGFSYGTAIGVEYIRQFPQNVRAMVLDGVVEPTLDFSGWLTQQTVAFEETMDRAFAACDSDASCPSTDLGQTYDNVAAMVEKEPIATLTGDELGPSELATAAIYVSYDPANWRLLGPALVEAEKGRADDLMLLANSYYSFGGYTSYAAVECIDTPHPEGAEAFASFVDSLEEISPRFGGSVGNELLPCAFWPVEANDAPEPDIDVDGLAPVLVLGNTGDAATPYENSVKVAELLNDAQLVTYNGEGHISYGRNSCVNNTVSEYVIGLVVPQSDPDC